MGCLRFWPQKARTVAFESDGGDGDAVAVSHESAVAAGVATPPLGPSEGTSGALTLTSLPAAAATHDSDDDHPSDTGPLSTQ